MSFSTEFWNSLPSTIVILVVLLLCVYKILRLVTDLVNSTIARMDRLIDATTNSSNRIVAVVDTMGDRLGKKMDHATETVSQLAVQCARSQASNNECANIRHRDSVNQHADAIRTHDDAVTHNAKPIAGTP